MEFKKNLMGYSDNGKQLRELVKKSSRGTKESHDFKADILCANAGYVEAVKLPYVVTEDEQKKSSSFTKDARRFK
jgi:hypothetical protein